MGSNPTGDTDVCRECCVLSRRCLCDELITRPEESCRLWCVVVCDLETSWMTRPWPTGGCCAKNKQTKKNKQIMKLLTVHFSPISFYLKHPQAKAVPNKWWSKVLLHVCGTLHQNPMWPSDIIVFGGRDIRSFNSVSSHDEVFCNRHVLTVSVGLGSSCVSLPRELIYSGEKICHWHGWRSTYTRLDLLFLSVT